MSLEWLDAIEARANAATPGPWRPVYEDEFNPAEDDVDKRDAYWVAGPDYVERTHDGYSFWTKADAEFVAAAREDIPRLCRAVKALHAALGAVLGHLVVDDLGLNCEVNDECCAGPAVLRAREVLERVEAGTI